MFHGINIFGEKFFLEFMCNLCWPRDHIIAVPPNITYIGDVNRKDGLQPLLVEVEEGERLTLQCDAQQSVPKPEYTWRVVTNTTHPIRSDLLQVCTSWFTQITVENKWRLQQRFFWTTLYIV